MQSEGGFNNGRAQWLLSARKGNPDLILNFLDDDNAFAPEFYDVLGKLQYQLTDHTSATANVLAAYDHLEHRGADGGLSEGVDIWLYKQGATIRQQMRSQVNVYFAAGRVAAVDVGPSP